MERIDDEAAANANLATNVDKLREFYVETDGEISVTFPAFSVFSLDYNFFRLLSNARKIPFDIKWSRRPDYASKEFYGTTIFWYLILYTNSVSNIESFVDLDEILVPSYASILEVLRYNRLLDDVVDLAEPPNRAADFYKSHPMDEDEIARKRASQHLIDISDYIPGYVTDDLNVNEYDSDGDGEDDSWDAQPIPDPDPEDPPEEEGWISGDDDLPSDWSPGTGECDTDTGGTF